MVTDPRYHLSFVLGVCLLGSPPVLAQSATEQTTRFFENNVRPVLANRCYRCHGPKRQRSGLRLDSLVAILKGGSRGRALKRGMPGESLLIRVLQHREKPQMPPKSKLPPREIAILTAWVKMGAPWPGAKALTPKAPAEIGARFTKEQKRHWAFHHPRAVPLPAVKNRAWGQSPIDRFILAELENQGLQPAARADRKTLIRRATFDLLGLPPSPEEVQTFVNDTSPDAFAKVLDRLLASPHYGERWGRRWLDVARYADSNGLDENLAYVHAWRYRDYVVRAFNQDKPYDRFVQEQLAGDLLPNGGSDGVIATGFLTVGPKMLAEDDPVKMEMDIIDEQLDTVGRTFMGLTLGCARCHDHKFDPIPTADYYSLAGIFKSTKTMDNFKVVAQWHERSIMSPANAEKATARQLRMDRIKQEIARVTATERQQLVQQARKKVSTYITVAHTLQQQASRWNQLRPTPNTAKKFIREAEQFMRGNVKKDHTGYGKKIGVILNKGPLPNVAEYDITLKTTGLYQLEMRYAAAQSRPVKLFINNQLVKRDAARDVTGSWYPDTQRWSVEGVFSLRRGKNTIRLVCAGPFPHFDKLALTPNNRPKNAVPYTLEQHAIFNGLNPLFLKQWADYLKKHRKTPPTETLQKLANDAKGPFALPANAESTFTPRAKSVLRKLRTELVTVQKSTPSAIKAMAVTERQVVDLGIHIRGSHLAIGKRVPRQFPEIFVGADQTPIGTKQSGRLELARWLTLPAHPLTARVMVNRLWLGHFGTGLVRGPDNFGLLGERPTNQPLLDWLALEFVRSGWSIKAMHRRIMLSSTYQMSTRYDAKAAQSDPENRLYWRVNRRRLEAEAIRDAILSVSGQLDRKLGGSLLVAKPRAYVTGTANSNYTNYDFKRRSLYLPVVRSALYDVFQAFDFPDPSLPTGKRPTTTVTPQALFMMNSDFVHKHTQALAKKLLTESDAGERLRLLYLRLYARLPSEMETTRALAFVGRVEVALMKSEKNAEPRRVRAWQSLCRVLIAANEFVYIE